MSFVLDNSVAMAWCFRDERTPATVRLLDRATQEGATAPWLWLLECSNVLLMAERRGRLTQDERGSLLGLLRALPITLDTDGLSQVWTTTLGIADRFRLTIYDAVYLELAHRLGLPLATLDGDLRLAAAEMGVTLLGMA